MVCHSDFVVTKMFLNNTVPTSVFATKPDLRDTFAGTLNQTPAKVGGDRGDTEQKLNLRARNNFITC